MAASLVTIPIPTAMPLHVSTYVSLLAVVIAGPMCAIQAELAAPTLALWAVLQQDLQKISQAAVPVVCAVIYMPQLLVAAAALATLFAPPCGTILAARASVCPRFVAKAQNIVIIIQTVIKAVAAQHLAVITHVAALCRNVLKAIGNRVMAALVVLTTVPPMVGKWNGVGKAVACGHLVSDVAARLVNQNVPMRLLYVSVC